MPDRGVFVASKNFYQLDSRSEFLKDTFEEKEFWKGIFQNFKVKVMKNAYF